MNATNVSEIRSTVESIVGYIPVDDTKLHLAAGRASQIHDSLHRLCMHLQYQGQYRAKVETGYIREDLQALNDLINEWLDKNPEVSSDI